jgi:hypothetical protein
MGGPDPGSGTGIAGMAVGWGDFLSAWEDVQVEAENYRELDSARILVLVRFRGRGTTSGLEIGRTGAKGAHLFEVSGGRVIGFTAHFDRERALADLGLPGGMDSRHS